MSDEEYFEQLVSNSLDGTLTDSEREKLEAHLAECPSCAALKQDLEQMRALFAEEADLPEGLHESIMQQLEQENKLRVVQPEKPARRMPVFTMVAAAAVVVLVVLGGGLMPAFSTVGGGDAGASSNATAEGAAYDDTGAGQAVADAAEQAGLAENDGAGAEQSAGASTDATGGQAVQPRDSTGTSSAGSGTTGGAAKAGGSSDANGGVWAELQPSTESGADAQSVRPNAALADALPSLTLPDSLRGTSVAHCYFADGGETVPDIDGELVSTADGLSWFLLSNNMTNLQDTLGRMEEAGFTVSAYEDVGLTIDSKATSWLLIVQTAA